MTTERRYKIVNHIFSGCGQIVELQVWSDRSNKWFGHKTGTAQEVAEFMKLHVIEAESEERCYHAAY